MVKPIDGKSTSSNSNSVQTQQTFRTISQPQMRMIAMPAGSVQTTGAAQIIQTHIMSQTMLKQVETTTRTQISALPSRTLAQGASITVSRAPTPSNFVARGPSVSTTNLRGTITTPIRTPTPPAIVTTVPFVRGGLPPKTPSPGGITVISPGSAQTWISGGNVQVQVPTQIIRAANISTQSPRGQSRLIAQAATNTVNSTNTSISSNNLAQGGVNQNPQQTFVATLATVLPSRQPAAALVYSSVSNPQQYSGAGPRLTVATSLGGQKQVRPIQLSNARLPTSGMGIRVSTTNLSMRAPNVPVLAPTSVLTSIPSTIQGRNISTTTTTNLTTSIPAARIIQVQQQPSGTQVINTGRLAGNLMTLHPVPMNTSATSNRIPATIATKVQPSLTITHVKSAVGQQSNIPSANLISTISGIPQSGTITITQAQTNQQQTSLATATSLGNLQQNSSNQHIQQQSQHITQLVSLNQQGVVNQGHQIVMTQQPILSSTQGQSVATVVPVAINTRTSNVLTGTITSIPTVSTTLSSNRSTIVPVSSGTTILPIAKVLPQQQHITASGEIQQINSSIAGNSISSATGINTTNQVLIHARSPNNSNAGGICGSNSVSTITNVISNSGSFLPTSGTFYYEHTTNTNSGNPILTLTTSSAGGVNTGNIPTNIVTSYAPSSGSFAVVPTNNRGLNQIHGIVPTSNQVHTGGQIQAIPVRFNPQLIVDGSQTHGSSGSHQIIMSQSSGVGSQNNTIQHQPTQMLIPVPTKMTSSPRPSILKKRENDGILTTHVSLKAVKNLNPSLVSISAAAAASVSATSNISAMDIDNERDRNPSPLSRPASSNGSTTVSATSSPGLDQQEHEELTSISGIQIRIPNEMQFKPVEIYQQTQSMQQTNIVPSNLNNSGQSGIGSQHQIQHQISTGSSSNDNDMTPRKKPRKQQLGGENNLEPHLQYVNEDAIYSTDQNVIKSMVSNGTNQSNNMSNNNGVANNISNNKENTQPVELTIKKPRTSLLENYKQTWKPAHNHFQRYSDVKPREERRPNVMDLANQAHVLQKVNGWKIYHLSSQMEDLCELESQVHSKLSNMLQYMETNDSVPELERVNDLIKGNMQRSRVIIDGVNEARTQIMKIFDHKAHVSDIIHRCASKRNFKKREKM